MRALESLFGFRTSRRAERAPACGVTCEGLESRQMMAAPPFAAGHTIVDITLAWSTGTGTTGGHIWIELYDQETPQTVANFLKYVDATDNHAYKNSFLHRAVGGFVQQFGGYRLDSNNDVGHIDTYDPVVNEVPSGTPDTWPPERRNLIRTVSMAKLGADAPGGGPDSATSEWFINLGDNTGDKPGNVDHDLGLDYQNGGFTVFGYVVQGWDVVQAIAGLEVIDASSGNASSPFTHLPVGGSFDPNQTLINEDLVVITNIARITNPGWSQDPGATQVINGAGKANGQTLFVTVNELGRAIAFHQASATADWTVSDINLMSNGPTLVGKVHAWADPKDGLFYATATTPAGLMLFKRSSDGFWTKRNLTTSIAGAEVIDSAITTFTSTENIVQVAGITSSDGHMVLYYQTTDAPVNGDYTWAFADLVDRDLTPEGLVMPSIVGTLSSYVTSWNGLNIAGLDASGNVQSIWWAPGIVNNHWRTDNLSALTGAPAFTGSLTPYVTSWGGINLAGTDATGKVIVTWWVPGNPWQTSDLTSLFSGPTLTVGSLSSYVTPWGGLNIAGLNGDGKIVVYWWAPGMNDWVVSVDLVPAAVQPATQITGVASLDGTINLVARGTNGDAMRYFWRPGDGGTWSSQDLSAIADFY